MKSKSSCPKQTATGSFFMFWVLYIVTINHNQRGGNLFISGAFSAKWSLIYCFLRKFFMYIKMQSFNKENALLRLKHFIIWNWHVNINFFLDYLMSFLVFGWEIFFFFGGGGLRDFFFKVKILLLTLPCNTRLSENSATILNSPSFLRIWDAFSNWAA